MTIQLHNVTLDCAEPRRVAAFWSEALGRPIDDGASDGFVSIGIGDPAQTGWFFIKVPEGKTVKNRAHFDLHAEDREAEVAAAARARRDQGRRVRRVRHAVDDAAATSRATSSASHEHVRPLRHADRTVWCRVGRRDDRRRAAARGAGRRHARAAARPLRRHAGGHAAATGAGGDRPHRGVACGGRPTTWSTSRSTSTSLPPFQRKVYEVVRDDPAGRDHVVRRGRGRGRVSGRGARRRPGARPQPVRDRRAVSSGAGRGREDGRVLGDRWRVDQAAHARDRGRAHRRWRHRLPVRPERGGRLPPRVGSEAGAVDRPDRALHPRAGRDAERLRLVGRGDRPPAAQHQGGGDDLRPHR